MKLNQAIVNPKNIQAMFNSKKANALLRNLKLQINNTKITLQSSVELLGDAADNKLKFDQYISRLCKLAGCQLNTLFRLRNYFSYEQKKVLI